MSSNGLACSVVWPEDREYVVLSNGGQGDAWQKLDAGPATAVAWSSAGCSYAVLHVTKVGPEIFFFRWRPFLCFLRSMFATSTRGYWVGSRTLEILDELSQRCLCQHASPWEACLGGVCVVMRVAAGRA